eukprot:s85_g10.t1
MGEIFSAEHLMCVPDEDPQLLVEASLFFRGDQFFVKGSRHGTTGIVVGSPGYMAPELMMRPANEKTDAFALGIVLLEILTGQPAWNEALGDSAVSDGAFQVSMVDQNASWPDLEVQVLGNYAVLLTSFDPNQRVTLASMEESQPYKEHLNRAKSAAM